MTKSIQTGSSPTPKTALFFIGVSRESLIPVLALRAHFSQLEIVHAQTLKRSYRKAVVMRMDPDVS